MKNQITVKTTEKESRTEIYIDVDLMQDLLFFQHCKTLSCPFALITDTHVGKLYGKPLLDFLIGKGLNVTLHTFKAGENSKSREVKAELEDELFKKGHGRDSCLIAMGGGVTTDLVGYIAATFCRGLPYFSIPTSFLAMVDASIGGKTGLNTPYGKNLIGAIYSPLAIFMDLSTLSTLSDEEMREGASEIIKHGLIAYPHLFETLDENIDKWNERDIPFLKNLIYESCQVKKKVVVTDPKEEGIRSMLNFGHTIAHAIEVIENYQISHGEAVAIGIIVESLISFKMKKINEKEFDEIYYLIKTMQYKLTISKCVTLKKMYEVMQYDKKAKQGIPHFVVLNGIGKVECFKGTYCTKIDHSLLNEALGWMIAEFSQERENT